MTTVVHVLILLLIAALSAPIAKTVAVPGPLLQIALGMLAGLAGLRVPFDPETFMLLFIPPLLFSDAFAISRPDLMELRRVIAAMALGLVLFSTLACGLIIHAMLPVLPIAACFALAAVLSPTDAVAINGMVRPGSAPRRFLHILEGEALLNDASGLVCFKFASAAAMTGVFSVANASVSFVVISVGGCVVGVVVGYVFVKIDRAVLLRAVGDPATQIVLLTLVPFAAYLAAERLATSGILASVAAGLTISQMRLFGATSTQTRLNATVVWEMIGFVFNGLIFLLLGLQLPDLIHAGMLLDHGDSRSVWWLPVTIIAITASLVLLRFVWIWLTVAVRSAMALAVGQHYVVKTNLRRSAAMSVAGARGAVTLAAVLSLPLATASKPGFPDRELLVILATGVIICSLILASLLLPLLLRGGAGRAADTHDEDGGLGRRVLLQAAINEIERARAEASPGAGQDELLTEAIAFLLADFNRRIAHLCDEEERRERALRGRRLEATIRLRVVRTQRAALAKLARARRITNDIESLITRELDFEEELVLAGFRSLPRPMQVLAETD